MRIKWPNLYIIGAAKTGTTTLHEHLSRVPGIYMAKIKEPHYFSARHIENLKYPGMVCDEASYLNLFIDAKPDDIIGESSTSYLPISTAAHEIYKRSPNAKIIISLRDPVERAFSHYLMERRAGHINMTFTDAVKAEIQQNAKDNHIGPIHIYKYIEKINTYWNQFSANNIKIVVFEEWIKNPQVALKGILEFIDIEMPTRGLSDRVSNRYYERHPVAEYLLKHKMIVNSVRKILPASIRSSINKKLLNKYAEKPDMDEDAKRLLISYYRDDVSDMEDLLGRRLPWRNFHHGSRYET